MGDVRILMTIALLAGCHAASSPARDLASADFVTVGDIATAGDMASADLAQTGDMASSSDMVAPCGGPLEPCCAGPQACDQNAAHDVAWFGSVCSGGTCQHCGGDGFKTEGGDGSLCCDAPNQCVPNVKMCVTTVDGPRCQ